MEIFLALKIVEFMSVFGGSFFLYFGITYSINALFVVEEFSLCVKKCKLVSEVELVCHEWLLEDPLVTLFPLHPGQRLRLVPHRKFWDATNATDLDSRLCFVSQ